MEPRNRTTRPATPRPVAPATIPVTRPHAPQSTAQNTSKKPHVRKKWVLITIAALVVLALICGALKWFRVIGPLAGVKADKYQAVILNNSQVYFGKISSVNHDSITLRDVYYFKAQAASTDQSKPQTTQTLIKLGNEVHGPDNEMHINKSQILYWENLRDDGQVVKTISQDK